MKYQVPRNQPRGVLIQDAESGALGERSEMGWGGDWWEVRTERERSAGLLEWDWKGGRGADQVGCPFRDRRRGCGREREVPRGL